MSTSYLARETGLSPTTIRYLGSSTGKHNKSTLVALSAVLGWRRDHLINILHGEPEKNTKKPGASPIDTYYENLLLAEVAPMREELAELVAAIRMIDSKINVIARACQADDDPDDADPDADAGGPPDANGNQTSLAGPPPPDGRPLPLT